MVDNIYQIKYYLRQGLQNNHRSQQSSVFKYHWCISSVLRREKTKTLVDLKRDVRNMVKRSCTTILLCKHVLSSRKGEKNHIYRNTSDEPFRRIFAGQPCVRHCIWSVSEAVSSVVYTSFLHVQLSKNQKNNSKYIL